MFTIRNIGGVALLLFGSTFMWLTPAFASRGLSTSGLAWSVTRVVSFATMLGFTVATWGLFRRSTWWEGVAFASAVLGLTALVPYWIAARHSGEQAPGFNVFVHVLGAAGVLALLAIPTLERWVNSHVMAGR